MFGRLVKLSGRLAQAAPPQKHVLSDSSELQAHFEPGYLLSQALTCIESA
jgi:hypothetical protein